MMLWQDVKTAVRSLGQSRASTAVAIVSLALAIGAIAAVSSLSRALFGRDVRVHDPGALVAITAINPDRPDASAPLSLATFEEIQRRDRDFTAVFAWRDAILRTVEANGARFAGNVNEVSGDYFAALGVEPLIGRVLDARDVATAGGASNRVAVLDYRCWDRRFGRDPHVLGQTLVVDGTPLAIVGVMPRDFLGLNIVSAPDAVVPIGYDAGASPGGPPLTASTFFVGARLAQGATVDLAAGRLRALWPSILEATVPAMYQGPPRAQFLALRAGIEPLRTGTTAGSNLRQQLQRPLAQLTVLALIVVLVAAVNLANLMLLRASVRRHQLGLRASLGATTWTLVRSLAVEGTLVALAGAALGLLIAVWLAPLLLRLLLAFQPLKPLAIDPRPDLRVVALGGVLAIVIGFASAIAPAWQVIRGRALAALIPAARGSRARTRLQKALVCAQLALAIVLTSAALLFGRSLYALTAVDPGFRTDGVLQMRLFPLVRQQAIPDRAAYFHAVVDALARLPGVDAVSSSQPSPLTGVDMARPVAARGSSTPATAVVSFVGPDFFRTMGMRVTGREIEWRDDERAPRVAVVSQTLARQLFPGRDAIGEVVDVPGSPYGQGARVVGVAGDASLWTLRRPASPAVFLALMQAPLYSAFSVQVHANGDLSALAPAANKALESLGRHGSFLTEPLGEQVKYVRRDERALAGVSAFLAGVTVLLAAAGLYGLLSYAVGLRRAEIGVRMAMGAQRGDIARLVLREALLLAAVGAGVGVPAAMVTVRLAAHAIVGVPLYDPPTFVAAIIALAIVTLAAACVPMRRAAATDPLIALRAE